MPATPYGFRIVGPLSESRRWVNARAAFAGYAACDPKAEIAQEAYLSAFCFDDDFRRYLDERGSVRGLTGPCGAPIIWFDIDRDGALDVALQDARRLAAGILDRYRDLDDDDLLLFFSGAKGFHAGVPTTWLPAPSTTFNLVARRFAEQLAARIGVRIDSAVYDKVRAFRAPNSKHPKTGLFKRRLSLDELLNLSADAIRQRAVEPVPFDIPSPKASCGQAAGDWNEAAKSVEHANAQRSARRTTAAGRGAGHRLQRETLDFIRAGAPDGERAVRLFRAAANLREFSCPSELAHALLTNAGLDSGLPPSEVKRQIDSGLAHAARQWHESPEQGESQA
jgi:hypothetical protein